jgi:hypothetical protein
MDMIGLELWAKKRFIINDYLGMNRKRASFGMEYEMNCH